MILTCRANVLEVGRINGLRATSKFLIPASMARWLRMMPGIAFCALPASLQGTQILLELLHEQQAEQAIYFGDYTAIFPAPSNTYGGSYDSSFSRLRTAQAIA